MCVVLCCNGTHKKFGDVQFDENLMVKKDETK